MLGSQLREGGFMGVLHGKAIVLPAGQVRWYLDKQLSYIDHPPRLAFEDEIEVASVPDMPVR